MMPLTHGKKVPGELLLINNSLITMFVYERSSDLLGSSGMYQVLYNNTRKAREASCTERMSSVYCGFFLFFFSVATMIQAAVFLV
jgi:hypothetical protein